jgi:hypothetical protein
MQELDFERSFEEEIVAPGIFQKLRGKMLQALKMRKDASSFTDAPKSGSGIFRAVQSGYYLMVVRPFAFANWKKENCARDFCGAEGLRLGLGV